MDRRRNDDCAGCQFNLLVSGRQLPDIPIQVFTNSHPICQELGKRERIT
ncbi:L-fucose operon activator [Salmonella enterica subsp. enterica serovar Typhimurium]|nr:L-fucose operon activator [Salmonella enterica subsp. enterica serovar Typhimurium]